MDTHFVTTQPTTFDSMLRPPRYNVLLEKHLDRRSQRRHLILASQDKRQLGGDQQPTPRPSSILPPVFIQLYLLAMHTILTTQTLNWSTYTGMDGINSSYAR